jgi:enoyl-CoA hydratase/carnithine racemase
MSMKKYANLTVEMQGPVAVVGLNRPDKRNAINDPLIDEICDFFSAPPKDAKVVVLHGHGTHFSAGLDLAEHRDREAFEVMLHSQKWHRTFHHVQMGGLPVVTAMQGAVVGGGLELATSTHVRVAEPSTFYALPEGQRGIFVGGGGSVRIARVVGAGRMAEMMLTGHAYNAQEGQAMGLSHYLVGEGEALGKAMELAARIATNAPLSNYAVINAIPRIADMSQNDGLFAESLMAAMAQTSTEARDRMRAFLEGKAAKAGS